MRHWQHVLSFVFSSREFWAAIAGALIGGSITGWFTLRAQKQAAKDQRIRDRETELEAIKGTLQAIETEVDVFKLKYLDALNVLFKEPNPKAPPANPIDIPRSSQSLFSVFDSNAAMLGRITDAALRRKIVGVYVGLKLMVDIVNHYTERHQFWLNLSHQPNRIGGITEAKGEVESRAENIRMHIPLLEIEIKDLLADIRRYLSAS